MEVSVDSKYLVESGKSWTAGLTVGCAHVQLLTTPDIALGIAMAVVFAMLVSSKAPIAAGIVRLGTLRN